MNFKWIHFFSRGQQRPHTTGLSFSEIGRKQNQEDYTYPNCPNEKTSSNFYILCDGMGGHDAGEVASKTVAESIGSFWNNTDFPIEGGKEELTQKFNESILYAYSKLDTKDTFSEHKMGTTMTCIIFNDKEFIAGHIGDSRIYQIRPSLYNVDDPEKAIIFKTVDDSLVNQLLQSGIITEEEAVNYPHKNIITKAMQPHQEKRSMPSIHYSSDIESGDYFFLCCDGILEQMTDEHLCSIVSQLDSDESKLNEIKQTCLGKTKDNFTCWLIKYN